MTRPIAPPGAAGALPAASGAAHAPAGPSGPPGASARPGGPGQAPAGRRGLLAGAPAAALLSGTALAAPAAAVPEGDRHLAGLLTAVSRAWSEYETLAHARDNAGAAGDTAAEQAADAASERPWAAYQEGLGAMLRVRAEGPVGLAAKIAVADLFRHYTQGGLNVAEAELLLSAADDALRLLRGLGVAPPPAPVPPSPDAALLDLCGQWMASCDAPESEARMMQRWRLLAGIIAKPAFAREGREAKAEILAACVAGRDDPIGALAGSLAADVLRGNAA